MICRSGLGTNDRYNRHVVHLSRVVRFCINDSPVANSPVDDQPSGSDRGHPPRHNRFSAWPPVRGFGRYYELHVRCAGEADPVTGYFLNISHIDRAVETRVLPHYEQVIAQSSEQPNPAADAALGALMRNTVALLQEPLGNSVTEARLDLTPYHNLTIRSREMDHVILRQQYEFAAAHRLHADALSDEENLAVFGKCNNPSGHGHNYRVEVAVRTPIQADGRLLPVERLDALVAREVVEKLDHKHLNLDVPQFAKVIPSVENIAKVIHEMLTEPVAGIGVELTEVSVWETGKTVCTYRGD